MIASDSKQLALLEQAFLDGIHSVQELTEDMKGLNNGTKTLEELKVKITAATSDAISILEEAK